MTLDQVQKLAEYCLNCKNPSCKIHCPVGNNIPQFISAVKCGNLQLARDIIGHNLGGICSAVCPHGMQCEGHCVRGVKGNPVSISAIESYVFEHTHSVEDVSDKLCGVKVAVIGGGPSGIVFATEVARNGADVTLYERNSLLGAVNIIPNFRLDKKIVDDVVSNVYSSKINVVKCNVDESTFDKIKNSYDVVYVATGLTLPIKMNITGEEYATSAETCLTENVRTGDVIIIGGGNTAMDCARTVARNGGNATVVYRRSREEMPAFCEEISSAMQDGVHFEFNLAPVEIIKNNSLQLVCAETMSENRGNLVLTDKLRTFNCNCVVTALGSRFDASLFGSIASKYGFVTDDNGKVADNVYAGGDVTDGNKVVAKAVGDALRTAKCVIKEYGR